MLFCFFCCCKNLLRPYCFVVMIITLIFHSCEIFALDFQNGKPTITYPLGLCHVIVICSVLLSIQGVFKEDENPLFYFFILAVFGFIPIVVDMGNVIAGNNRIFMFDTCFIENTYGSNAVKPFVCLILTLVFFIKCDFIVVVQQYGQKVVDTNSMYVENAYRNFLAHRFWLDASCWMENDRRLEYINRYRI